MAGRVAEHVCNTYPGTRGEFYVHLRAGDNGRELNPLYEFFYLH